MNKKFLIFVLGIFLIGGVSASDSFFTSSGATSSFSSTTSSTTNPFYGNSAFASANYNYGTAVPVFSGFDTERCGEGQDFMIQVAPFGCEPAVVRSDLLEEQNYPVFCQLAATKLNPLIEVKAIDYISFGGQMPEGVSGIGFHPANAALRGTQQQLLNSPVLENIGYAVIVLNQNKNESSMPDYVEGEVTANIRYDLEYGFGIGPAVNYLPVMEDSEWETTRERYSFWQGRGFLRSEGLDEDSALVSVYTADGNRYATFDLAMGDTSAPVYLPGFYCLAAAQLRLDDLVVADDRAQLIVDGQFVEVMEGEKFYDGNCYLGSLDKKGLVQTAGIRCVGDDKTESTKLTVSPTFAITYTVDGQTGLVEASVGDYLFSFEGKNVYLAYASAKGDIQKSSNLILGYVAIEEKYDKLPESELIQLSNYFQASEEQSTLTDSEIANTAVGVATGTRAIFEKIGRKLAGYDLAVSGGNGNHNIFKSPISDGVNVRLEGYAGMENRDFIEDSLLETRPEGDGLENRKSYQENYEKSIKDFQTIVDSFASEKDHETTPWTYGEKALVEMIKLSYETYQREDTVKFCNEFTSRYPDSLLKYDVNEFCGNVYRLSNSEADFLHIIINGKSVAIGFKDIVSPTVKELSATVLIAGKDGLSEVATLRKDVPYYFGNKTEYLMLTDVDDNSARFTAHVLQQNSANFPSRDDIFTVQKDNGHTIRDYTFRLTDLNFERIAKVSIVPQIKNTGTTANFTFKIGIEKRAIQLSPEKTREQIETVEQMIKTWEGINKGLGEVVKGFKTACLAVGSYMSLKTFFENLDGSSISRQEVMTEGGGWNEWCTLQIKEERYSSVDMCILENSDSINSDVEFITGLIEDHQAITKDNIDERMESLLGDREKIVLQLGGVNTVNFDVSRGSDIRAALTAKGLEEGKVTLQKARDIERYVKILDSGKVSSVTSSSTSQSLHAILKDVEENAKNFAALQNSLNALEGKVSLSDIPVVVADEYVNQIIYTGKTCEDFSSYNLDCESGEPVQMIAISTGEKYVLVLEAKEKDKYTVKLKNNKPQLYQVQSDSKLSDQMSFSSLPGKLKSGFYFIKRDVSSYNNQIKNPEVKYFATAPYQDKPSIVPFDKNKGWYVGVKQTVSALGDIAAYDDSGVASSFSLCNVMSNGLIEFEVDGNGDDECVQFTPGVGVISDQAFGMEGTELKNLISRATEAITDAERGYKDGAKTVSILGESFIIGNPSSGSPELQCQNFMSPEDCQILFNACDPVICPSSRCNLGGTHYVANPIQSGIIGSIALCLPNIKEGIYVPVCLSGLHAGIESWITIMDAYKSCLENNLETGEMTGICDEMFSFYQCDFFWKQALPFTKSLVPNLLSYVFGENEKGRGGGEYLNIQSAWQHADASVKYLVEYYAGNSYNSFKARATDEIGGAVCKSFISTKFPTSAEFFDTLIQPDSPNSYIAYFSENVMTTATVPPTSHYKVYYHIFAGKDTGAYFSAYLKSGNSGSYPDYFVASGYINRGDYVDETKDFTAPTGYTELCIRVNENEECGFQQVSSSFAEEYLGDLYETEQASQREITTEAECISGTSSLYSLATPNLESGLSDLVSPELYNGGIIRICATENPGKNVDDNYLNPDEARWIEAGYCGDTSMKCWMDRESVENVIANTDLEESALANNQALIDQLLNESDSFSDDEFESLVEELEGMDASEIIEKISDTFIAKAFWANQKVQLYFIRGGTYREVAMDFFKEFIGEELTPEEVVVLSDGTKIQGGQEPSQGTSDKFYEQVGFVSPTFEFDDGAYHNDLFYSFRNGGWKWSWGSSASPWCSVTETFCGSFSAVMTDSEGIVSLEEVGGSYNEVFLKSMEDVKNSYVAGLELLHERTIKNEKEGLIFWPTLNVVGKNIRVNHDGTIGVNEGFFVTQGNVFYFSYLSESSKWRWAFSNYVGGNTFLDWNFVDESEKQIEVESSDIRGIIEDLKEKSLGEGLAYLFSFGEDTSSSVNREGFCSSSRSCSYSAPTLTDEFYTKVDHVSQSIGISPCWLMTIMYFESAKTFSASVKNPGSSATGLIQFIDSTAKNLGTTTSELAAMSEVEQLDYVEKYFKNSGKTADNLCDAYLIVFTPSGVGKSEDFVLHSSPSDGYAANKRLDSNGDGEITRSEACATVRLHYSNFCPSALSSTTEQSATSSTGCPDGMTRIYGTDVCIDTYENSLFERGGTSFSYTDLDEHDYLTDKNARSLANMKPQGYVSYNQAEELCDDAGKRICSSQEWLSTCKGSSDANYPYGNLYSEDKCNDENSGSDPLLEVFGSDVYSKYSSGIPISLLRDPKINLINGGLAKTGEFSDCKTTEGVYDMVGNLNEWTSSWVLMGGSYLEDSSSGCNNKLTKSSDYYDHSTGFRCCFDVVEVTASVTFEFQDGTTDDNPHYLFDKNKGWMFSDSPTFEDFRPVREVGEVNLGFSSEMVSFTKTLERKSYGEGLVLLAKNVTSMPDAFEFTREIESDSFDMDYRGYIEVHKITEDGDSFELLFDFSEGWQLWFSKQWVSLRTLNFDSEDFKNEYGSNEREFLQELSENDFEEGLVKLADSALLKKELEEAKSSPDVSSKTKITVAVFGDSISAPTQNYASELQSVCDSSKISFDNFAVSGYSSQQIRDTVFSKFSSYDYAFILGGVNDWPSSSTKGSIYSNLKSSYDFVKNKEGKVVAVSLTPWKAWIETKKNDPDEIENNVESTIEINQAIAEIVGSSIDYYINVYDSLDENDDHYLDSSFHVGDGLHPNEAGDKVIAKELCENVPDLRLRCDCDEI